MAGVRRGGESLVSRKKYDKCYKVRVKWCSSDVKCAALCTNVLKNSFMIQSSVLTQLQFQSLKFYLLSLRGSEILSYSHMAVKGSKSLYPCITNLAFQISFQDSVTIDIRRVIFKAQTLSV